MTPWKTIGAADTEDGRLELECRDGRDFLITIDGRTLMSSTRIGSETELSTWGCGPVLNRDAPRVLTAGLGLGFTLRAALDILPASAQVVVAELNPVVVEWCRGPAASVSEDALSDARVELVVGDVMECVRDVGRGTRAPFDAIVIDLYEGPGYGSNLAPEDPLYGHVANAAVMNALTSGGVYAVWGEEPDSAFEERLRDAGFQASSVRPRRSARHHVIYVATKP